MPVTEHESVQDYKFEDFLEADLGLKQYGQVDVIRKEEAKGLRRMNRLLWMTGLAGLATGAGLMITQNLGLAAELTTGLLIGGAVALAAGAAGAYRKIYRKAKLDLPNLTVRRKVLLEDQVSAEPAYRKSNSLRRDVGSKVFMGVASGLARYVDVNVGLVRLAFVFAFMLSGGTFAILYFILGLVLPEDGEDLIESFLGGVRQEKGKGRHGRRPYGRYRYNRDR